MMNEAIDLTKNKELMDSILVAVEAFRDDVLPAIKETMEIAASVYPKRPNVVRVAWTWDSRHKSGVQDFGFYPVETDENFLNRVKAYLFDLAIMAINL